MNNDLQKTLEGILALLKSLESRMAVIEGGVVQKQSNQTTAWPIASSKKLSVKEFLLEKKPKGAVQTTLAIAYFLETVEGIRPMNRADLESGFRAAKETIPENLNDKINMNVGKGHMMEAQTKKGSMKAWELTSKGELYVQANFNAKL